MSNFVFLNGGFVAGANARLSIWEGGWLHGAGLFETMRAAHGQIFRLDAHLDRLTNSARALLFPIERPDLPLTTDFEELLSRNELAEARVRLTVSSGPMLEPGSDAAPERDGRPSVTVCATAAPFSAYSQDLRTWGMSVMISPYRVSPDDPLAGHKCTSYLSRLLALRHAQARRCSEALWFTTNNLLSEGSISNVFLVKDGALATPPLETPVLPGITRAAVLELAAAGGIEALQRALTINDLLDADEVFLTNSMMEIMPVRRVEKHAIGGGKPGPMTQRLAEEYRRLLERECKGQGTED
ncbi:MAG TPA: aminotransferase class IV [Phycisphaerae bacterium]|nr:aminotransferase class IV [Phycisphaerae bacterium]